MLETLRKHHYVLMSVITVIVIVAFMFLYDPNRQQFQRDMVAFRLYGRGYSIAEKREIVAQENMIGYLVQMGRQPNQRSFGGEDLISKYQMAHYISMPRTGMNLNNPDQVSPNNFVFNTVLVREEAKRLGIEVDEDDLKKGIMSVPAFQENGAFSKDAYNRIVGVSGGGAQPFGDAASTEKIVNATVKDALLWQKLEKLLSTDYLPTPVEVDKTYLDRNVITTGGAVLIERKAYEAQTVTDEDIQKYYDAEKDKKIKAPDPIEAALNLDKKDEKPSGPDPILISAEKRVVKYVYFPFPENGNPPPPPQRLHSPSAPPKPPEPVAPAAPDITGLPEDQKKAKEDEFARQKTAYEEELKSYPALLDAWRAQDENWTLQEHIFLMKEADHKAAMEAHQAKIKANADARIALDEQADKLSNGVAQTDETQPVKDIEVVAKEQKLEVKAPAAFAKDAAPDDIKGDEDLLKAMFEYDAKAVELNLKSGNYTTKSTAKGHCVFTVLSVEAPAVQPLAAVKEKLSEKLKKDKIDEALKKAAEEVRTKLAEAIKAGKPFAEAVTAAGPVANSTGELTFSANKPIEAAKVPHSLKITEEAKKLNPGEISEPVSVEAFNAVPPPVPPADGAAPPQSFGEGMLLVWVGKKEIMDDPKKDEQKKAILTQMTKKASGGFMSSTPLLKEWLEARLRDARAESEDTL